MSRQAVGPKVELHQARRISDRINKGRALLEHALSGADLGGLKEKNAHMVLADVVVDLMLASERLGFSANKILKLALTQFKLRDSLSGEVEYVKVSVK